MWVCMGVSVEGCGQVCGCGGGACEVGCGMSVGVVRCGQVCGGGGGACEVWCS